MQNALKLNTAEEIGRKYGVAEATVKRDAEFSKSVDKIANEIGEKAKEVIGRIGRIGRIGVP